MTSTFAAGLALLTASLLAQADTTAPYIEKPLDGRALKLPLLAGFAPACDESTQIAQRAELLPPRSATFITCFVDTAKWRAFTAGRLVDFYPYIAVTVHLPVSGGSFSRQQFEALRSAAHERLKGLVADNQGAQQRLAEQDQQLAANGIPLTRRDYRQSMQGFFESPGDQASLSYITVRSSTVAEAHLSTKVSEVNAVTTLLHNGRLIQLNVVDQADEQDKGARVKDITAQWLGQFRTLNQVEAP